MMTTDVTPSGTVGENLFGPSPVGFDLCRRIAVGQNCELWKLLETQTRKPFVWKRLRAEFRNDEQCVERIRVEAEVLSRVDGPFVVRLHQSLTGFDPPSLILEWLPGISLEARLRQFGAMPPLMGIWTARQTAQGLRTLANAGHSHGDLRPGHILADSAGALRLIDPSRARTMSGSSTRSSGGIPAGPVEYLAPELQLGNTIDPVVAGVYSLGVILFEVLTGRLPFPGENRNDILRLHRQAKPPSLERICPRVPAAAVGLIESMLCKEPLRRPRDLAEIIRRLLDIELNLLDKRKAG